MTVRILLNIYVEAPQFSDEILAAINDARDRVIKRGHLIVRSMHGRDCTFGFRRLFFDVLVVFDLDNIQEEVNYLRNMLSLVFDSLNLTITETWIDHYVSNEADTLRRQLIETLRDIP